METFFSLFLKTDTHTTHYTGDKLHQLQLNELNKCTYCSQSTLALVCMPFGIAPLLDTFESKLQITFHTSCCPQNLHLSRLIIWGITRPICLQPYHQEGHLYELEISSISPKGNSWLEKPQLLYAIVNELCITLCLKNWTLCDLGETLDVVCLTCWL